MKKPTLGREKHGDWYIYPKFIVQESSKAFKPNRNVVFSTGTSIAKKRLSVCIIGYRYNVQALSGFIFVLVATTANWEDH